MGHNAPCPMPTPFDDVTVGATRNGMTSGATPLTPGPSRFAPGAIVAGRYRLIALLGRGGMGLSNALCL